MVNAINTDYESSAAEDLESLEPSSKYENPEFALLSYARTNKLPKLKALLDAKLNGEIELNLNFKGKQKQNFSWSALHLACYFGHIDIVHTMLDNPLLRCDVDINIQNIAGDTPLHKAALTKRYHIVQLLLSYGANVFVKNCDGLLAKQLTDDQHIVEMLMAAEQTDKNKLRQHLFKAVDDGDLVKLQTLFKDYGLSLEARRPVADADGNETARSGSQDAENNAPNLNISMEDLSSLMVDERGNTLLHHAALRNNQAICVYLLEQGFDPYRKNLLGETCLDLAPYHLRQLFLTVRLSDDRLKKYSQSRIDRFEGPLMKKVRILGWRQIYVVLDNGAVLLFNNRRDSMNKSRRGYKYLESATCEPDPSDAGIFTISFSDKSKACFLVNSDNLNQYPSLKLDSGRNQIELIRQRWLDAFNDHIRYSTDFIRKGLSLNDNDDEDAIGDGGDLATLNHLLPMDTIKTYIQEARAHYSILDRHAESLCNLVQSINSSPSARQAQPFPDSSSYRTANDNASAQFQESAGRITNRSDLSSGSRMFGLIRGPSRNVDATDGSSGAARRNSNLTSDFLQDDWHCILFHLKLLMESTQNTKTSMSQALALMEHQEQLRQCRLQDQEEKCRILEESLHALARDHHELEKSVSMSHIYHPNSAMRSISMSTDLNEYHDAFEDFDDEKTMTPTSMHSDEDETSLHQNIRDVLGHEHATTSARAGPSALHDAISNNVDDDDDDDDMQSNCSALTVETISEFQSAKTEPPSARAADGSFHR